MTTVTQPVAVYPNIKFVRYGRIGCGGISHATQDGRLTLCCTLIEDGQRHWQGARRVDCLTCLDGTRQAIDLALAAGAGAPACVLCGRTDTAKVTSAGYFGTPPDAMICRDWRECRPVSA